MAQDLHAPPRVEFTLAGFLLGPSRACGMIEDRFRRVRRRFTVELHGAWIGELFLLDERFDYDDGRRETRQWTVRNAGKQQFTATAPDCVGVAHGRVSGGTIHTCLCA